MKIRYLVSPTLGLALAAGFTACSTVPVPDLSASAMTLAPEPVETFSPIGEADGWLEVHTDPLEWEDDTFTYLRNRDYHLYDAAGHHLAKIANSLGRNDESPARVRLAPGSYFVSVPDQEPGRLWAVRVERGRTTRAYTTDGARVAASVPGTD